MKQSKYRHAYKGQYIPINPHKWANPNNIQCRSSIEFRYMRYFDMNPSVIKIASEKIVIPYFDPVKRLMRRYIVDLLVQFKTTTGSTQTVLIEVKSSGETAPPKAQKVITEAYREKISTWSTNQAKWEAAADYCKKRGWIFKVFDEKVFSSR